MRLNNLPDIKFDPSNGVFLMAEKIAYNAQHARTAGTRQMSGEWLVCNHDYIIYDRLMRGEPRNGAETAATA